MGRMICHIKVISVVIRWNHFEKKKTTTKRVLCVIGILYLIFV